MVISVWEIIGQADGGLSVLRTFRLLRVLKLVRFLPALRRQLVVLMKTMDNVATFCMLLMLFIFTFRCAHSQRTNTQTHQNALITFKVTALFLFSAAYSVCICLAVNLAFRWRTVTQSPTAKTLTLFSGPSSLYFRLVFF